MASQTLAIEQNRKTSTENPRNREGFFVECSAKRNRAYSLFSSSSSSASAPIAHCG